MEQTIKLIRHHIIASRYQLSPGEIYEEAQNCGLKSEKRTTTVVIEFPDTETLFDFFIILAHKVSWQ